MTQSPNGPPKLTLSFVLSLLVACASTPPPPDDADTCVREAEYVLAHGGDTKLALGRLERAIEINPDHEQARLRRAEALLILRRRDDAIAEYTELIRRRPKHAVAYLDRAIVLADAGRTTEAEADFAKVIEMFPDYPNTYLERGQMYRALGREAEAEADFAKARERGAALSQVFYNEGVKELNQGKVEAAYRYLTFAVELERDSFQARVARARALMQLRRFAEAAADLSKAVELSPEKADLYVYRGNARLAAEKFDAAMADFDKAIALDPALATAHLGKGIVLFVHHNDLAGAEATFTEAIRLGPDRPEGYLYRARVYHKMKVLGDAEKDLRESLRRLRTADALYEYGLILHEKGEPKKAVAFYLNALESSRDEDQKKKIEADLKIAREESEK